MSLQSINLYGRNDSQTKDKRMNNIIRVITLYLALVNQREIITGFDHRRQLFPPLEAYLIHLYLTICDN
jgi:hypothetical protein